MSRRLTSSSDGMPSVCSRTLLTVTDDGKEGTRHLTGKISCKVLIS